MIKPQISYCPLIWMCSSRKFMTEMYKIINGYTPPVKDNFLSFTENTHGSQNPQKRVPKGV